MVQLGLRSRAPSPAQPQNLGELIDIGAPTWLEEVNPKLTRKQRPRHPGRGAAAYHQTGFVVLPLPGQVLRLPFSWCVGAAPPGGTDTITSQWEHLLAIRAPEDLRGFPNQGKESAQESCGHPR